MSWAKLGAASASSETSNTLDSLRLGHQIDLNTRPLIGSGFWPLVVMLRYLANITNQRPSLLSAIEMSLRKIYFIHLSFVILHYIIRIICIIPGPGVQNIKFCDITHITHITCITPRTWFSEHQIL